MARTPFPLARLSTCASLVALLSSVVNPADAKSLYMIADINSSPSPIRTYDIQTSPNYLVLQAKQTIPSLAGGAVGLAIDTDAKKLFATYEGSNTIQLVDATNFNVLGTTTAPGASNLAGIVVDQGKKKVYAVDRTTNHLYVYSWVSATNTLTLDGGAAINLAGVTSAYGLALDEANGHLYVGDASTASVRYFNTTSWALENTLVPTGITQTVMSIAVDTKRGVLYMGNAYQPYGSKGQLVKYVLATGATSVYTLPGATPTSSGGDNIVGLAVDEDTGNVYATTGNQGSGGTDTLITFDQNLTVLKNDLGDIGSPTGMAIPRASVSYNPLNFTKKVVPESSTVITGHNLTYELCYDNPNEIAVTNVSITDTLPANTTLVSATGPYSILGSTLTWLVGTVNGGATKTCYDMVVKVNAAAGTQIVNGATITGLISDSSVPTTQTVTTDVIAEAIIVPESTTSNVEVKGEGGGGSAGLIELLFGGAALATTAWRRRRASAARQAAVLALSVTAAAAAQAGMPGVYVGGGLGQAKAESTSQDMADDLVARGYGDAQVSLHNTHTGGKLFAGYRLNPFVAFEAAFVDLGRTTSTTKATVTDAQQSQLLSDVGSVHPILIKGLGVTTVVGYPIGDFSVFGKLGLFNWTSRAKTELGAGGPVSKYHFSGTNPTYGFGLGYDIPGTQLSVRGEWEHFATSRNDIKFVSMSVAYRF